MNRQHRQRMADPSRSGRRGRQSPPPGNIIFYGEKLKQTPLWEDIVLILAIFTIWPLILHKENIFSKVFLYIAFILCVVILIKRIKRMTGLKKKNPDE